jgi:hypothetical protein
VNPPGKAVLAADTGPDFSGTTYTGFSIGQSNQGFSSLQNTKILSNDEQQMGGILKSFAP